MPLRHASGQPFAVNNRSHAPAREDGYRLGMGLIGAEAMLRLYAEPEANERAFTALARFLDLLDETDGPEGGRPALDAARRPD